MKRITILLLFGLLFTGCGSSLKHGWSNFRAYYNTYYNAEKNFRAGLKKVKKQPVVLNPVDPVRIHPAPVQAGKEDFKEAIDKGAKILRKFPDSKWVDDAILLIGKSYYYEQEFYPALKKFEELQNYQTSVKLKQLAVIWKGRTLLDLGQYGEGVSFLEKKISLYKKNWPEKYKAELEALAGEHHAMLENWKQASEWLAKAVTVINDKKMLGRTFFLYGQTLERQKKYKLAYNAFSKVKDNFPGFEYVYWAEVKRADIARFGKKPELAISIYKDLMNDDKYFQRRYELKYKIARTQEMSGQQKEAEQEYKQILRKGEGKYLQNIRSDIYYRLGKINSDYYHNYSNAAAYFDSSSTASSRQYFVSIKDAGNLAATFGEYTRLQSKITRADSLLRLGAMDRAELDSVLKKIKAQKKDELISNRRSNEANELVNLNQPKKTGSNVSVQKFGFLNYRNAEQVNRARAEFKLIWGPRPLVDNWRRREAIQQLSQDTTEETVPKQRADEGALRNEAQLLNINLDEIPTTREAKRELMVERVNARYELGNLLFLNLDAPEKAKTYFHKVLDSNIRINGLLPRAMYSLFEIFQFQDQSDSASYWKKRILDDYPDTRYSQKIQNKSVPSLSAFSTDSSYQLVDKYHRISDSAMTNKAFALRMLALSNQHFELASYIYFQSIKAYIHRAKAYKNWADSVFAKKIGFRIDESDSVVAGRFSGSAWDSVRFSISEFDSTFADAPERPKVDILKMMLEQPPSSDDSLQQPVPSCQDLGITLKVQPNMQQFLSTVEYPDDFKNKSISGVMTYSFVVNKAGEVKSYNLVTKRTSLGIEDALEEAFEKNLHFAPLKTDTPTGKVKCEVDFPIRR